MKSNKYYVLLLFFTTLFVGFAFGYSMYYIIAIAMAILLACASLNIYNYKKSSVVKQSGKDLQLPLKGKVTQTVTFTIPFYVFIDRIDVTYAVNNNRTTKSINPCKRSDRTLSFTIDAEHVGEYHYGISEIVLRDFFSIFVIKKTCKQAFTLLVLPEIRKIKAPALRIAQEGQSTRNHSQEDFNAPDDVRSFLPGDALKRVHWKLSLRSQSLLVRKYESPTPNDTLILLDPTPSLDLDVRDMVCSVAVSLANAELLEQRPVRLPFHGSRGNEFASSTHTAMPLLSQMVARQPFSTNEHFAPILAKELKRIRQMGRVFIVSASLEPSIIEQVQAFGKSGKKVVFYFVSKELLDDYAPMVSALMQHFVEVHHVQAN